VFDKRFTERTLLFDQWFSSGVSPYYPDVCRQKNRLLVLYTSCSEYNQYNIMKLLLRRDGKNDKKSQIKKKNNCEHRLGLDLHIIIRL